jgi:hypothetical protein
VIDYAAAWTELAAWVAEEPNRGRQATLVKMAELSAEHTVAEDDLERALRLAAPRMTDLLFNRVGQLVDVLVPREEETETTTVTEGSAERRPEAVGHSMAVA